MTREQAIDEAVRRCTKPGSRRRLHLHVEFVKNLRATLRPRNGGDHGVYVPGTGHPDWWRGSVAERALELYPQRIIAIRAEFRRIVARA